MSRNLVSIFTCRFFDSTLSIYSLHCRTRVLVGSWRQIWMVKLHYYSAIVFQLFKQFHYCWKIDFAGAYIIAPSSVEMLEEAIVIIRKLWTEEFVTFKGRHYSLKRANL